jgi:hypothetical protein
MVKVSALNASGIAKSEQGLQLDLEIRKKKSKRYGTCLPVYIKGVKHEITASTLKTLTSMSQI